MDNRNYNAEAYLNRNYNGTVVVKEHYDLEGYEACVQLTVKVPLPETLPVIQQKLRDMTALAMAYFLGYKVIDEPTLIHAYSTGYASFDIWLGMGEHNVGI